MKGLAGKVAIVTGATGTMGATIAQRLSEEGVSIVAAGRNVDRGRDLVRALKAHGASRFIKCDVTREEDVKATIQAATQSFGRLDIVINNAAAVDAIRAGDEVAIVDEEPRTFEWIMKVGVYGPFLFAKYGVPAMLLTGGGVFIAVSSVVSRKAWPGMAAYPASKAALESLTNQIAVDYGALGIRGVSVRVGSIRVDANQALHDDPEVGASFRRNQMLQQTGTPEDVAGAIAYLSSDEAKFITASVVTVDGGMSAKQNVPDVGKVYMRSTDAGSADKSHLHTGPLDEESLNPERKPYLE